MALSEMAAQGLDVGEKSRLQEASILPVWLNQRTIGGLGYVWIWIGMAVIIATFQLGAGGVAGLPLATVIGTIFLANLSLGLVMALTADIGTEHGISFAVYLRAPFGTIGTHLPSVTRGIVAAAWFGIQTYLGALALNGIVSYLGGFDSWVFWYVVFGLIQVVNTAMGIRAVQVLASIAAPAIVAISIWMYFTLENVAAAGGHNIWTFAGDAEMSVVALFVANMAFWSALAVDIPNITRFLKTKGGEKSFFRRNRNVFVAQFIALPVAQSWIALIGAVSFIATGDWNPVNVIQEQGTGATLVVLLAMVILAQWSTNTSANLIPAALTFVNAGAPRITYAMGIVIAGIIGTLTMPWLILNHLFTYLGMYGAVLSAVGGIMVCDYFLIRGRRLNVPDLYRENGQFRYFGGWNPAGLIAWAVGGGLALYFIQYAYVVGFPAAMAVYYVLMKIWVMPQHQQAEVTDPDDAKYLATSVNLNWVYTDGKGMQRVKTADIPDDAIAREDL
ncbi:NCS1 family transporter [Marinovum sp. 2_MG-2023]|uniref:NCS1 family transporter n=1 Tax=unclassified Marinovum TaxID=2647166 RepID=UPI0026E2996F|nr:MULTISPECIES: NCS1 family transporter [unclassified Marinovum]MDO6729604.1 NCS1 family transporter [Marinovum sp. 2_MG-2023]MDO6780242.1 NCS1 family transporter [Marinovum sp. 1_MG-2023]